MFSACIFNLKTWIACCANMSTVWYLNICPRWKAFPIKKLANGTTVQMSACRRFAYLVQLYNTSSLQLVIWLMHVCVCMFADLKAHITVGSIKWEKEREREGTRATLTILVRFIEQLCHGTVWNGKELTARVYIIHFTN